MLVPTAAPSSSNAEHDTLRRLWLAGWKVRAIGAEMGRSISWVSNTAALLELPRRPAGKSRDPVRLAQVRALDAEGVPRREIAARLGVWPSRITEDCQAMGLPPAPRGDRGGKRRDFAASLTPLQRRIWEMAEDGGKVAEIAREVGVSPDWAMRVYGELVRLHDAWTARSREAVA